MFELFIARRYLRRRQGKGLSGVAAIGIGGVFVGVAATLIVLSVMNGFHLELRTRILGVTPHIMISKVFGDPIENYDSLARIVRTVPGVKEVAPFIFTKTMVRSRTTSDGVIIRGIIREEEDKIIDLSRHMKQGKFDFTDNGLVLGYELAQTLGVGVGDELSLVSPLDATTPALGLLPRLKKFRVNGIFDAGMYEYNTTLIYLSLTELQQFLNLGQGVSGLEVSGPAKADPDCPRGTVLVYRPFAYGGIPQRTNLAPLYRLGASLFSVTVSCPGASHAEGAEPQVSAGGGGEP